MHSIVLVGIVEYEGINAGGYEWNDDGEESQ